jgi:transcriptional regulator with XRE-family HTH domain
MIKNERQYQNTQKKLKEFQLALDQITMDAQHINDKAMSIKVGLFTSQLAMLTDEIDEFNRIKEGRVVSFHFDSLQDLSGVLIKARIAKGWTQGELAGKLEIPEQSIQRYETNDYESADLVRLVQIFEALELELEAKATLAEPKFVIPPLMPVDYGKVKHFLQHRQLIDTSNESECAR